MRKRGTCSISADCRVRTAIKITLQNTEKSFEGAHRAYNCYSASAYINNYPLLH